MAKKNLRVKEPVKNRFKTLANGCDSIILDTYTGAGRQRQARPPHTEAARIKDYAGDNTDFSQVDRRFVRASLTGQRAEKTANR
ncbi:hypothetical protein Barb6XT_02420 [Bacteroidales bacterium Barb6XT]|nr:hypothetical protein Barb6XT_02420 [Bacteroidales bacterium Barb6XT]